MVPPVSGIAAVAASPEQRRLAPPTFRRELTPTWMSTCAVLAGVPPLDTSRGLRVLDLACRSGVQAAVLAAVHPEAEILAYDHDPAHVERARDLALAAGLDNLFVAEAKDAGRATDGAGDVDVLLLDDVVALSDEDRSAANRDIVRHRVRAGGLVAVSYRTTNAWAELAPLRHLARQLGVGARGGDDDTAWFLDVLAQLRAGAARHTSTVRRSATSSPSCLRATPESSRRC